MKVPDDVHPDDSIMRRQLRDSLVQVRESLGLSQRELGERMGIVPSAAWYMEDRTTWRVSTLQRWCRHLGLRLLLYPVFHPLDASIFSMLPQEQDKALAFERRAFMDNLAEARKERKFHQKRVGEILGMSENAIGAIEQGKDFYLVNMQRISRAINSHLVLDLVDLPESLEAAA